MASAKGKAAKGKAAATAAGAGPKKIRPEEVLRLDIDYSQGDTIKRVMMLSDFTYFDKLDEDDFASKARSAGPSVPGSDAVKECHYDLKIQLNVGGSDGVFKNLSIEPVAARAVGVRCYAGGRVSITCRVETGDVQRKLDTWLETLKANIEKREENLDALRKCIPPLQPGPAKLSFEEVGKKYAASGKVSESQPVSIRRIVSKLHEEIFYPGSDGGKNQATGVEPAQRPPSADRLHGAILIAGRTKSCKSLITRGLIHSFLTSESIYRFLCSTSDRRPHFVTCEDPVEAWFDTDKRADNVFRMVDYTPRDRTCGDYVKLSDCFRNGLRQTPACFLAGEVRDDDDIRSVLEFAATGHLVFATLHAGSLVDLFNKVFEAAKAKTPAARGLASQSILAAVHLQLASQSVGENPPKSVSMVMPALWRRTPASTAALVSAGVGALMPNCPTGSPHQSRVTNASYDCLGRQYFARSLLSDRSSPAPIETPPELIEKFISEARRLDLSGT
ncbi:MAG: ATPase, T2SS/T4P/T4SS family [Planctomycetaceae bacterium]